MDGWSAGLASAVRSPDVLAVCQTLHFVTGPMSSWGQTASASTDVHADGSGDNCATQDVLGMLMKRPDPELEQALRNSGGDVASGIEALKSRRAASLMSKFLRDAHPGLAAALIDERDQHMVDRLRSVEGKGVAVVGLAHLDGIEARWQERM